MWLRFTDLVDSVQPEEVTRLLNEYLEEMAALIDAAGATLVQVIGDGLMVFFAHQMTWTVKFRRTRRWKQTEHRFPYDDLIEENYQGIVRALQVCELDPDRVED